MRRLDWASGVELPLQVDVVHPDHLAAMNVDDLLIQQIALQQHQRRILRLSHQRGVPAQPQTVSASSRSSTAAMFVSADRSDRASEVSG